MQTYTTKTNSSLLIPALIVAALVAFSTVAVAQAEIITFDDLPVSGYQIPNGYGGLQWNSFDYEVGSFGGYANGAVSPDKLAFNDYGHPASFDVSSGLFNLNYAYLTGAWNDGLQVEVQGFIGGTSVYDNTYTVNTTGPTLINFNYLGIDEALFTSFGGTLNPAYDGTGSGNSFAMDNLSITFVPEPSTFVLLSLATMLLIFRRLTTKGLNRRARVGGP